MNNPTRPRPPADHQSGTVLPSRRGLHKTLKKALYRYPHSFVDYLPWVEYLAADGVFLLEDNASVGAVFELKPRGTEGRTQDFLATVRDTIEDALQDAFEEYDDSPWVLQTYTFDSLDLDHHNPLDRHCTCLVNQFQGLF